MFKGSNKKVVVHFNFKHEGSGGSSTSIPLKDGNLVEYLDDQQRFYGELTITYVGDGEMHLTTSRTREREDMEDKVHEIGEVVRNYVKERAIKMDVQAVFAKGVLKGIFGRESNARLKRSQLINEGFEEEDIEIKPLKTDSFQDFL